MLGDETGASDSMLLSKRAFCRSFYAVGKQSAFPWPFMAGLCVGSRKMRRSFGGEPVCCAGFTYATAGMRRSTCVSALVVGVTNEAQLRGESPSAAPVLLMLLRESGEGRVLVCW